MSDFLGDGFLAQAVGILASAFIIFGYYCKDDVTTKKILMGGSLLFTLHFFMLGGMTAMIINFINFFRVGASIKFHKSKTIFWFFILVYLVATIITYETWIDILPFIATVFSCIGMYFLAGIRFRQVNAFGAVFWLTHNILAASWGGIITEIFILKAHMVTIWRLKKEQKSNG